MDVILKGEQPLRIEDFKDAKGGKEAKEVAKPPPPSYSRDPGDNYIQFGSKVCLQHMNTGGFLRTPNLYYRKDLGQSGHHIVYNFHSLEPRQDDWWEVFGIEDEKKVNGLHKQNIQYGSRVRLFNVTNSLWLHSHNEHKSPVTSGQGEVTGFGSVDDSNAHDHWIVEKVEAGSDFWRTSDVFLLRHQITDRYLHSHATLFAGEKEVIAFGECNNLNNLWRARIE
ncbi:hypothetical protein BGX26_000372 [Mortierella sp. AD094]|nr:hypothetical protein BGX26_000372 [Mortierella sp. AD094]